MSSTYTKKPETVVVALNAGRRSRAPGTHSWEDAVATPTPPKSELDLMIEHAKMSGNYPVVSFYENSWLPRKAQMTRQAREMQGNAKPDTL